MSPEPQELQDEAPTMKTQQLHPKLLPAINLLCFLKVFGGLFVQLCWALALVARAGPQQRPAQGEILQCHHPGCVLSQDSSRSQPPPLPGVLNHPHPGAARMSPRRGAEHHPHPSDSFGCPWEDRGQNQNKSQDSWMGTEPPAPRACDSTRDGCGGAVGAAGSALVPTVPRSHPHSPGEPRACSRIPSLLPMGRRDGDGERTHRQPPTAPPDHNTASPA